MTTKRCAAGILRDAANTIQIFGLAKGVYKKRTGQMCVLGAMGERKFVTATATHLHSLENDYAANALHRYMGFSDEDDIVNWNDAPERTGSQVIKALRGAARALEHGLDMSGYAYGGDK